VLFSLVVHLLDHDLDPDLDRDRNPDRDRDHDHDRDPDPDHDPDHDHDRDPSWPARRMAAVTSASERPRCTTPWSSRPTSTG
jgi:hypothetical protein